MTEKRFENLMADYLAGEISESELMELHAVVHASEEFRQRFQEASRLNVMLRQTLVEQVELQSLQITENAFEKTKPWIGWGIAAGLAVAAIVMLGAILGYQLIDRANTLPSLGVCLNVSGGELWVERNSRRVSLTPESNLFIGDLVHCMNDVQAMLRLADGSILSMEPGAKLELVSDQPEVKLVQGEVLFEIAARDSNMPAFEVQTGQSTVEVMGTVFTLAADHRTKLKVYEGRVMLTRHSDEASVEVGAQQMTATDTAGLSVEALSFPGPLPAAKTISIEPTDDVTLNRGKREIGGHLKVEGNRRTAYLRFDIPDVKRIRSARLRLTQDVDTGAGTLRFFQGSHSDWTESELDDGNAPQLSTEVARRSGIVRRGEIIEVDVSRSIIGPGPMTIGITLDLLNENDIWFGSRQSAIPPQLILTVIQ